MALQTEEIEEEQRCWSGPPNLLSRWSTTRNQQRYLINFSLSSTMGYEYYGLLE